MNLLQALRRNTTPAGRRADGSLTIDDWLGMFSFGGNEYPLALLNQSFPGGKQQELRPTLSGLAEGAMRGNGIVFACILARQMLFSEARFQYRPKGSITSNDLYGKADLEILETPWPGGTTRHLLRLVDLFAQLSGNGYVYRDPVQTDTLRVPRSDWMSIVLGSRSDRTDFEVWDVDTEVIGYIYRPYGAGGDKAVPLLREQVAHFMPVPDPVWHFRGMSWLAPVVREIMGDNAMTQHKLSYLENGATPNLVVTLDPSIKKDQFEAWVDKFEDGHKGAINAYKTIYLAGGADATVIGSNLEQLDFRSVQAHGETRVCNAAGIPPIIVGVSEGLDSATYSNYAQARRAWADAQLRPLWADICETIAPLVSVPGDSELWYDERRIAFLAEDLKDAAEIQQQQVSALRTLLDAGFTPESAAAFLETGDFSVLQHSGLYSVQLQPPGTAFPNATVPAQTSPTPGAQPNGNGAAAAALARSAARR